MIIFFFFFSSRRRHTRWTGDWSSDVCSSDLHPLDHDRFHVELSQRQSTLLLAHSLWHGLRWTVFPPLHASECRRNSDRLSSSQHDRRRTFRPHLVPQRQRVRTCHRHALVLFCRQLYTFLFFSLRVAQARAPDGAALPRVGLSLVDWNRPRRFRAFSSWFDRH